MDIFALKKDLIRDEGMRLKPYRCTAGKLTIGVGRNLDDVGLTRAEAEMLLENDVLGVIRDLDRCLPWWKDMDAVRQRALANMCFNLGIHRLMVFRKMLTALQTGSYATASQEALNSQWARQTGSRAQRIALQFETGR